MREAHISVEMMMSLTMTMILEGENKGKKASVNGV
jgi:hypothetical protein